MKLEYLYIDGYKGLKGLELRFKEQHSPVAVDFLVGKNGSGKSSVLEALGLIFTRIMQKRTSRFCLCAAVSDAGRGARSCKAAERAFSG